MEMHTYEGEVCRHCGGTERYIKTRHCVNRHKHAKEVERFKQRVTYIPVSKRDELNNTKNSKNCYDGSPPPCDSCDRSKVCAAQLLACKEYRNWVSPSDSKPTHERIPTHEIYQQMHGAPRAYSKARAR